MQYYSGARWQKGHGLGRVFGALLRAAVPVLKATGKKVGKQVLNTGLQVGVDLAQDAFSGKNMKQAAKARMTKAAMETFAQLPAIKHITHKNQASTAQKAEQNTANRGRKRKAPSKRGQPRNPRNKKRKVHHDIFD